METNALNTVNVKEVALIIIGDYMGEHTARMYKDFYSDLEDNVVLSSVRQLLEEYVGGSRSVEILVTHGLIKNNNV